MPETGTHLGPGFEDAIRYALVAHAGQVRKGTRIPYAAHLLAVSALILEAGGTEVQAIAGLLHDCPEDCGGEARLDDIKLRFGAEVGAIVEACSDSLVEDPADKKEWVQRKADYLAHLSEAAPDVLLVSLADKAHNANAILTDLRDIGTDVFLKFKGSQEQTIGYYDRLASLFEERETELTHGGRVLVRELRLDVDAIAAFEVGSAA